VKHCNAARAVQHRGEAAMSADVTARVLDDAWGGLPAAR